MMLRKEKHLKTFLVTGCAGFIGFHVANTLIKEGFKVIGIDSINDYYSTKLKKDRLQLLQKQKDFCFHQINIADVERMKKLWETLEPIDTMIHLAAQPGVRYSISHPFSYVESNLVAHMVMLELARHAKQLKHFVYASSSSVYGGNHKVPFSTEDRVDHPISLYAATKRSDELMTECYSHLYDIPATGLRFFTVYGPWGRPDMAAYLFTQAIDQQKPFTVYNQGKLKRDFTYIDDIVSGVIAAATHIPQKREHKIYNLGNSQSENLMDFIGILEECLGKKAIMDFKPLPASDPVETYADISSSTRDFGFLPKTSIQKGLPQFVEWYKSYHNS